MTGLYAYLIVAVLIMFATLWVAGVHLLEQQEFQDSPGLFGMTVASIGVLAGVFWPATLILALLSPAVIRVKISRNK